ncbi:TonB-dependent receptor [Gluconacetobacter diazotrophicus PA1 5]|uniref:TonB-dependent receptor n=2 Tax=Gluconacetobacter diazotrophicus TaxID=33996 RepID=A9H869_GLUDA|nr:TonB-dependent receptor [Gluconacetobacter diazotrophicus]ACI51235.1 TonB-dependent receptor [Gluconacetobacter diazotrophicus PA1 5]MBB2155060.1 TonB-dependent receptor [Gluconacetobacter diazotrophicus]TWB09783.1 outer membrane receptor protein involved in Fe transport [Gluconacetobacter diazotrophicus]CAP54495.1 TonB-dependent receptor [Gluconacetobacter diazotrophicus PA1 5]
MPLPRSTRFALLSLLSSGMASVTLPAWAGTPDAPAPAGTGPADARHTAPGQTQARPAATTVTTRAAPGQPSASAPESITVTARLDRARAALQPSTGATVYSFSRNAIETVPGGDNAPLNSVLLQAPGVAQDSYGQIHVRGDHNEVQFRLDGVQLPEGLTVFGQTLMTRFADSMTMTTGALPSEYGFLQAAVIDITTKNGTTDPGGEASIYGGARDYFFPSLQYGGHSGKWDYFATGDFVHDRVGIENTTSSFNALHDLTNQYHFLGHLRYTADDDTRISLIAGVSNAEYQLPNNPGQQTQFQQPSFAGSALAQQLAGSVDSASLDERQREITDFAILSLQKEIGRFSLQSSAFLRYSSLDYSPDMLGDLVYNGIAQQASRSVFSSGTQSDVTWRVAPRHTVRFGYQVFVERNVSQTDSLVFPQTGTDAAGNAVFGTTPESIHQGSGLTGTIWGLYIQDEWKPLRNLTVNYGLRMDGVDEYTHQQQLSPRLNLVWTPWRGTTLHAGYSRYFTPPPFEVVSGASVAAFNGTSAQAASPQSSTVKAESDHYFDAGITQRLLPGWQVSFDAYYKLAHNLIDEGQFGAPIILSGFNYRRGQVNGYELATSYDRGPLSLYGNMAWSRAIGKDITSAQFNFSPDDLAYIQHRWIYLDHDQRWTASAGASYSFFHRTGHPTRLSATMVYGSGLRADGDVPNGVKLPQYVTFNLSLVQSFQDLFHVPFLKRTQLRLDVINLFDRTYELRDGTGIGVGAPQYGLRRTILTGISQRF